MKVVVLQSNYIPWKGYFDLIHDADLFIFYDEVKYTKNDWRNRNKIYSKNGLQWITIPISPKAVKLKISDVGIAARNWQQLHYKAISLAYSRAPFYHELKPLLEDFLIQKSWDNLSALNQYVIKNISHLLGITTRFLDSKDFKMIDGRIERLVDLLKQVNATEYISGPAAKAYLKEGEELFEQNRIAIKYKDYGDYPTYPQLSTPFVHGVSIIDLIANIGFSNAPNYLWGHRNCDLSQQR